MCSALRTLGVAQRHRRKPQGVAIADGDDDDNDLDDHGVGSVGFRGGGMASAAGVAAGGRRRRRRSRGGGLYVERERRSSLGEVGDAGAVGESGDGVNIRWAVEGLSFAGLCKCVVVRVFWR